MGQNARAEVFRLVRVAESYANDGALDTAADRLEEASIVMRRAAAAKSRAIQALIEREAD